MAKRGPTRFDRIRTLWDTFERSIQPLPASQMRDLYLRICGNAARRFASIESDAGEKRTPRSRMVAGMEQGIRDVRENLLGTRHLDPEGVFIRAFDDALKSVFPDYLVKEAERLQRILTSKRVRSEGDWYRLQGRLAEIEGLPGHEEEEELICALMDNYE